MSFEIDEFWLSSLGKVQIKPIHQQKGWIGTPTAIDGFIEPGLSKIETANNPKIYVIAAPGAVGKSTYARALASKCGFTLVDLAESKPLGGDFFTGGLINAFGDEGVTQFKRGEVGLVVDALDEAQLRVTDEAFDEGMRDLARLVAKNPNSKPIIAFGRRRAAEQAYFAMLEVTEQIVYFQIENFDPGKAKEFIKRKLPVVAGQRDETKKVFDKHRANYEAFAIQALDKLEKLEGVPFAQFGGYAPVLDAICAFTLSDTDGQNPFAKAQSADDRTQVGMIINVIEHVLRREQSKLGAQLKSEFPQHAAAIEELYRPDEQLGRLAQRAFGATPPSRSKIADPKLEESYNKAIKQLGEQHPFLNGKSELENLVFHSYVTAWCLRQECMAQAARRSPRPSALLFWFYRAMLGGDGKLPISIMDLGILYMSFAAAELPNQHASLELVADDDAEESGPLVAIFEFTWDADAKDRRSRNVEEEPLEFVCRADGTLRLNSPISNVFIDADINVELCDRAAFHLEAPISIACKRLEIDARSLIAQKSWPNLPDDDCFVTLVAECAETTCTEPPTEREGVKLSLCWPGAKTYPWSNYATEPSKPKNPDIEFLRRRLRKVLTAFRSHSKRALVRFAKKIDHARMVKNELGQKLVDALIADNILNLVKDSKFYQLDVQRLAELVGMSYNAIQTRQFSSKCDEYLDKISARKL